MGYFSDLPYNRRKQALLIGIGYGICGVLVDVDHLVCYFLEKAPIIPGEGIYGCRLWHDSLLLASGIVFCIGVSLAAGLCGAMVYYPAWTWIRSRLLKKYDK